MARLFFRPAVASIVSAMHMTIAPAAWAQSALASLRSGSEIHCEPALPYFCENMHVQCAGRTRVPTFAFKLRRSPDSGTLSLVSEDEDLRLLYASATATWEDDGHSLLLQPVASGGYVKLLEGNKFVLRHYIRARGVMSIGLCR